MTQKSHHWAYTMRKTAILKHKYTPVFTAALFTIARTCTQPRYPSADEWIRYDTYIYTMQYYSDIKRNIFESDKVRWMNLEPLIRVK